ncbi:hypothetical protein JCM19037_1423 [Geomicrobium sp. JCM 19037]|uniref:hypothetical protein n=1 Tax=Geomicrobium sp. JCM 19037 TaxID=1460634 RepID=UPI00045F4755|nr:hypothetical protein [Geomicrobium sp. JCM 19037]GAK03129.1 hypothetical protein JCM19037_1423 [Geomicrobium sp. JCM 19037]
MEDNLDKFDVVTDDDGKWLVCRETGAKYLTDGFNAWYRKMRNKQNEAEPEPEEPTPPNNDEEVAQLTYMLMHESARNDSHDKDIGNLYYELMRGGVLRAELV